MRMQQGNYQIQKQQQVQTLSPQQVLAVKLLELPTVELEERVKAELLDNPALEEGPSDDDTRTDDEYARDNDGNADDEGAAITPEDMTSLFPTYPVQNESNLSIKLQ